MMLRRHTQRRKANVEARTAPKRRRAFTIIEVLVVIAVIGLLIALLIPSLSSAAASSRSLRCQVNLRQMAAAANNYSVLWNSFPVAIRYELVNGQFRHVAWDWVTTNTHQIISPGSLWSFTDRPGETCQCPDYHGAPNHTEEFTGYNYNTGFIGGEAKPFGALGWKAVRPGVWPHACHRASQCAMFGDGGRGANQTNKYMRPPTGVDPSVAYSGAQAFRHARATNVAFVDGHVGSMSQAHPGENATDALLMQMGYPANGFLSNDDSAYDPR